MANVQAQFDQFHDAIKLGRFDENQTLRDKRDIIRKKLSERLPTVFAAHGETCPVFAFRNQGSYELDTGIKPRLGDYDIDQGLYFAIGTADYRDPVVLKQRLHEALKGHTKNVRIRRSCVTVTYQRDGEALYHVDIAVYADGSREWDGKARLAKGREGSEAKYRVWEVSDPLAFSVKIEKRFEGIDRQQFRRVVRYLKRWRDVNFPADGNAAPLGIGLTVAAYDQLRCVYADRTAGKPNDLVSLRDLVHAVLGRFTGHFSLSEFKAVRRLSVQLPVEPHNDLFARSTDAQMSALEEKLTKLKSALDEAIVEVDPVEACKLLQKVFGGDFPVPAKDETGKRVPPAIVSSSSSA